jgi:hypothetical protein
VIWAGEAHETDFHLIGSRLDPAFMRLFRAKWPESRTRQAERLLYANAARMIPPTLALPTCTEHRLRCAQRQKRGIDELMPRLAWGRGNGGPLRRR